MKQIYLILFLAIYSPTLYAQGFCGKKFLETFTLYDCAKKFDEDSLRILNSKIRELHRIHNFRDEQIQGYKNHRYDRKKEKELIAKAEAKFDSELVKANYDFTLMLKNARENRNDGINYLNKKEEDEKALIAKIKEDEKNEILKKEKDLAIAKKMAIEEEEKLKNFKNNTKYIEWKSIYLSKIQKGKILMNKATQIRKKYIYTNRLGNKVFQIDNFSAQDKNSYLKTIEDLSDLLSSISELNYEYGSNYENYYNSVEVSYDHRATELFKISQFYNSAW